MKINRKRVPVLTATVLLLSASIFLNKCSSTPETTEDNVGSENMLIDSAIEKSAFIIAPFKKPSEQPGHFFSYRFRTSEDRIDDIEQFLRKLSDERFNIILAWYFSGPNCGSSKTIYHPQFIIQLASRDLRLNSFNFIYTTGKLIFKCSENTVMYLPVK